MNVRKNLGQAGFTMIELIVVILILGILASIALPKFYNLGGDARLAKIQGVEGSMKSALAIVYSAATVKGITPAASAPGNTLTMSDGTVVNLAFNWPDASAGGIPNAAGFNSTAGANQDGLNLTYNAAAGTLAIYPVGAQNSVNCTLTYTAGTAALGASVSLTAGASDTTC